MALASLAIVYKGLPQTALDRNEAYGVRAEGDLGLSSDGQGGEDTLLVDSVASEGRPSELPPPTGEESQGPDDEIQKDAH